MPKKKILGFILELNPPHNGHKYLIEKAKEIVNPDLTIAVISTNFSMRGDIMVLDKFTKTKIAMQMGIDLVLELPTIASNCSADYFAYNSVAILNNFNVTDIAFGVELDNKEKLETLINIIDTESYNKNIKKFLDNGFSYNTACNKALNMQTNDFDLINNFSMPNNTLAIQYIRSIRKINNTINYHLVKRIDNNYFDYQTTGAISSATSIRNKIQNSENYQDMIFKPDFEYEFINQNYSYQTLFNLLKYNLLINNLDNAKNILGINEGIDNRLFNIIKECDSYDEFINKVVTKRYTTNKIKRLILNILLNIKEENNLCNNYNRILGFNNNGELHIKTLSKDTKKNIITSFKNVNNNIANIELKSTFLYGIITNNKNLYLQEFNIPIRSDKNGCKRD